MHKFSAHGPKIAGMTFCVPVKQWFHYFWTTLSLNKATLFVMVFVLHRNNIIY